MRSTAPLTLVVLLSLALGVACGSGSTTTLSSQASTAPVSLTIRDAPPTGVTVLSFEVTLTGAVLQPGNVSLVSSSKPVEIEITQLQTEAAFLSTFKVPTPGPYTSLVLTFANPELTILNGTTNPITAFGRTCAASQVCEFKPSLSSVTVTVSLSPQLSVTANTPAGLVVDANLNNIIQSTLSIDPTAPGAISVTQVSGPKENEELEELEDILGKVQSVGSNQFSLQDSSTGLLLAINVDNNTKFEDFDKVGCTANPQNFSCIKAGQIVEVDLSLLGGGTFLAKEVELEDDINQEDVKGTIVSLTGNPPTAFQMVVHEEVPDVANISVGNPVTVTIEGGANFRIDNDGLDTSGFSFGSASELLVGQEVQVHVKSVSAGPPVSIAADRITLRMSQITAQVGAINTGNSSFTLTNLPSLFPFGSSIQVLVSQADFENVTPANVSGLATNNTVSVKGLLFNTVGTIGSPTLVAKKVRKRS